MAAQMCLAVCEYNSGPIIYNKHGIYTRDLGCCEELLVIASIDFAILDDAYYA